MTLGRHSLYKKQMERKHVILNAVKDLVFAIKDDLHCKNEILHCVHYTECQIWVVEMVDWWSSPSGLLLVS